MQFLLHVIWTIFCNIEYLALLHNYWLCNSSGVASMHINTCNGWGAHCEIALRWIPQKLTDVNIGSSNGLVPSGNKPFPEPILSQNLWHQCYYYLSCFIYAVTRHVTQQTLLRLQSPGTLSSLCNSFEDRTPVGRIYRWLILKWVAVISLKR